MKLRRISQAAWSEQMKPMLAIVTDINIFTLNRLSISSNRGKGIIVASYVCRAVIMGLIATAHSGATTVVAVAGSDRIVLGADALARGSVSGSASVCKIHRENGIFFAIVGLLWKHETAFYGEQLVGSICRESSDIRKLTDRVGVLAREPLQTALTYSRDHDSLVYKRDYVNHTVFEVVLAGFVGDKPIIGIKSFFLDSVLGLRELDTITLPDDVGHNAVFTGEHDAINAYTENHPDWSNTPDLFGLVSHLIGLEIIDKPYTVGPPVAIVEIRAKGYQWLAPGQCPEQ